MSMSLVLGGAKKLGDNSPFVGSFTAADAGTS